MLKPRHNNYPKQAAPYWRALRLLVRKPRHELIGRPIEVLEALRGSGYAQIKRTYQEGAFVIQVTEITPLGRQILALWDEHGSTGNYPYQEAHRQAHAKQ